MEIFIHLYELLPCLVGWLADCLGCLVVLQEIIKCGKFLDCGNSNNGYKNENDLATSKSKRANNSNN